VFQQAYNGGVSKAVEWLLDHVYYEEYDNDEDKYTFIVDEKTAHSECEPNLSLEWFFGKMIQGLGKEHQVCKDIRSLIISKGYTHFYKGDCGIDAFMEKCIETDLH
jgi:hypothetical protein